MHRRTSVCGAYRLKSVAAIFDEPCGERPSHSITGLQAAEVILCIDIRPATGQLYALGSASRLYVINETNGAVTQVGSAGAFTLSGTKFGFDINPVVDRIRVVSDNEQNLRLNPNDGALTATDTFLNYAVSDVHQAANPNVIASAYTRNFAGATTTTLYGIDSALDILVIQNPPNGGILNTVGPLGLDISSVGEFDILGTNDAAFAVLTRTGGTVPELFAINLATGQAQSPGTIGAEQVRGFAIVDSPPSLRIGRAAINVVISWPASSAGFFLENTPALGPSAVWSTNASAPVISNETKYVTNAMVPATRFHRLRR